MFSASPMRQWEELVLIPKPKKDWQLRRTLFLLFAVLGLRSEVFVLSAWALPELPRVWLDTTYTPSACTVLVPAGGNLQAAIDNASLGDTLCLEAGATFLGSFTLRNKTAG